MTIENENFDPKLQKILDTIVTISFTLSTGILPIIVYMIAKKSRQMKKYRYYMLNNVLWCYIYHAGIFFARPVLLFPSFCIILNPMFWMPDEAIVILFFVYVMVIINMDLSVVWSLFYRYSQAFPGWLNIFFERSYSIYLIYSFVHVSIYSSILIPLYLGRVVDKADIQEQFLFENPHLSDRINSTMLCFVNTQKSRYMGLYIAVLLIAFFILGNNLMLFRAISVQLYIGYCFLLIPTVVVGFLVFWRAEFGGKSVAIVFTLMSLHDFLDYLTMLYFITPYRRTVMQWLRLADKQSIPTARVTFFTTSTVIRP
ncbi:hypothetical protein M3Y97_01113500 [Aphelenchoides bicaudatus]|nr:hypothetical protein M3Y97_01113500 [Aphelenchoides bicaudatus]